MPWLCAASEFCISWRTAVNCASERRLADQTSIAMTTTATTTAASQANEIIRFLPPSLSICRGEIRIDHSSANQRRGEAARYVNTVLNWIRECGRVDRGWDPIQ